MKRKIIEFIATGFYIGKIPWAPGTFGTVLGIPVVLALKNFSPFVYMGVSFALLIVAVVIAEIYEVQTGNHDFGEVVIDEVVGFVIAMTWIPATPLFLLAGFVLFRFFDIVKPPPIRQIDQKVEGGLGTILDDAAAGLAANVVLQLIYVNTNWLGEKWNGSALG